MKLCLFLFNLHKKTPRLVGFPKNSCKMKDSEFYPYVLSSATLAT